MNRRQIIIGTGAGVALVGAGAWWRVSRAPETAFLPWEEGPPPADIRLDAFRHAILAPNPHNRQPWRIRLDGSDGATLSCDLDRRLPQTDPFDRQITIGFGTFLEVARIAAAQRGHVIDITHFPDGEPAPRLDARPVARLKFRADPGVARDPLFAAIRRRHTNRELFETAPPASGRLAAVAAGEAQASGHPALMAKLRQITEAAIVAEVTTPRTWQESVDVFRIGAREVDANPDGLAAHGPMMEALSATGILTRPNLSDTNSTAFKSGLDSVRGPYGSVPAAIWIATAGNSRAEQLDAGRRYVRVHLRATLMGLAMHPLSQSLQEYPEVAGHYAEVHRLLGVVAPARLQMLARIGKAPQVGPAPRWPLEKHLV